MLTIPNWVMAVLVLIPFVIISVLIFKIASFLDIVFRKIKLSQLKNKAKEITEQYDIVLVMFKFFPYIVVFYYISKFALYVLRPDSWGMMGGDMYVTPVKNSTRSMTELLLMEGVPVSLVTMIGCTLLRILYKILTDSGGKG